MVSGSTHEAAPLMAASNSLTRTTTYTKFSARALKRKSRAKAKPLIKELLVHDKLTFRDLVHQFTGGAAEYRNAQAYESPASTHNHAAAPVSNCAHPRVTFSDHKCIESSAPCACRWSSENAGGTAACSDEHLSHKDAMLASAYIAQSLKTLECISAYLLKSSSSAPHLVSCKPPVSEEHKIPTDVMMRKEQLPPSAVAAMRHNIKQLDDVINMQAKHPVTEPELAKLLHMMDSRSGELNTFLSLSCLSLLNRLGGVEGLRGTNH